MKVTAFTRTADGRDLVHRTHSIIGLHTGLRAAARAALGIPVGAFPAEVVVYRDPFPDGSADAPTLRTLLRDAEPLHVWRVTSDGRVRDVPTRERAGVLDRVWGRVIL